MKVITSNIERIVKFRNCIAKNVFRIEPFNTTIIQDIKNIDNNIDFSVLKPLKGLTYRIIIQCCICSYTENIKTAIEEVKKNSRNAKKYCDVEWQSNLIDSFMKESQELIKAAVPIDYSKMFLERFNLFSRDFVEKSKRAISNEIKMDKGKNNVKLFKTLLELQYIYIDIFIASFLTNVTFFDGKLDEKEVGYYKNGKLKKNKIETIHEIMQQFKTMDKNSFKLISLLQ